MMHATKETWVLSAAAMAVAVVFAVAWQRVFGGRSDASARGEISRSKWGWQALAALAAAAFVAAAFYSSFGAAGADRLTRCWPTRAIGAAGAKMEFTSTRGISTFSC